MSKTTAPPLPATAAAPHDASALRAGLRRHYLQVLTWAFALFNTTRMVAYLPTLWAIHASGDASQHSLWTWGTWLGANATMAAWLYEQSGGRLHRAVAVSLGNTLMCAVAVVLILWYRH